MGKIASPRNSHLTTKLDKTTNLISNDTICDTGILWDIADMTKNVNSTKNEKIASYFTSQIKWVDSLRTILDINNEHMCWDTIKDDNEKANKNNSELNMNIFPHKKSIR